MDKYMRRCKRCNELYRTPWKYSKICEKCRKVSGFYSWKIHKKKE